MIETQWKVAHERYEEAREGSRKEDLAAAQAKARQAAANVKLSDKRVKDTRLLSPINGVVARRLADAGEMIAAGMPVVSIDPLSAVDVRRGDRLPTVAE